MDSKEVLAETAAVEGVLQPEEVATVAAAYDYTPPSKLKRNLMYVLHNWELYAMLVPGLVSLLVFAYGPMLGIYIAFIDYKDLTVSYFDGTINTFVGWFQFRVMLVTGGGAQGGFLGLIKNTIVLSTLKLFVGFPMPIILAILINEVKNKVFKSVFQTISYMPYFISWVVVAGILKLLINTDDGLFNKIALAFGGEIRKYEVDPSVWRPILLLTSIWKGVGYSTITYLAILTSIDPQLYEAAMIDGANKWKQVINITLPGIAGIASINFIMNVGSIFGDDVDQCMTLCGNNDAILETTQLLGTYIYEKAMGGQPGQFPVSTAMGLCQSLASLILIMCTNFAAEKLGAQSVW